MSHLTYSCSSIFATAECTQLWQFVLAQGFCGGIGAGFIYLPCAGTLSHWFKKKRTLCFGCIAAGSSIGGVIFREYTPLSLTFCRSRLTRFTYAPAILLNRMFAQHGFKWGVRTAGFLCLALVIAVNLLLKPRLPPRKLGHLVEPRHLRDPVFALFVCAAFFINMGMCNPVETAHSVGN